MCAGVVYLKSGNKETLDLVNLRETSRNRGLFFCKLTTFALRYSFPPEKALDLYYSNAAGVQEIG